jgi:hypothetical protein
MADKTITIFDVDVPAATGVGVTWAAQYEQALIDIANRANGVEIKNLTTGLWGSPVSGGTYSDTPLNRKILQAAGFMERADVATQWETPTIGNEYKVENIDEPGKQSYMQYYSGGPSWTTSVYTDLFAVSGATALKVQAAEIVVNNGSEQKYIYNTNTSLDTVAFREKSDNLYVQLFAGTTYGGSATFTGWVRYTKS